jgi:hypothetical protein
MMVVWGARYRAYFTDYCLPSLLAPHNIPSIVNKRDSRFAIATTAEDWAALNELDVFNALKAHIEPVLMELPPFESSDSKMLVMSSGHKKLSNYAFEIGSFGININPDSIYSDRTILALQESARKGIRMVLYPGVRFELEGIVTELRARGMLDEPTAITVPPRIAAGIGIRNPHPFTSACHWDNDCFFEFPVYHYLLDQSKSAMVVHTISMGPIMLDYGAIDTHCDEIFEKWTLDGDYAHSNFGHFSIDHEIEYVDDSDTFMVLGFTPKDEDNLPRVPVRGGRLLRDINKGLQLWRVYSDPVADPLKKRLYLRQVVIHETDLGRTWQSLAARDRKILDKYVVAAIDDPAILEYYVQHDGRGPAGSSGQVPARAQMHSKLPQMRAPSALLRAQKLFHYSVSRSVYGFTAFYNRADFLRRHYSAQGPAHARLYYYRTKFFVLHNAAQAKARLRALAGRAFHAAAGRAPSAVKALLRKRPAPRSAEEDPA